MVLAMIASTNLFLSANSGCYLRQRGNKKRFIGCLPAFLNLALSVMLSLAMCHHGFCAGRKIVPSKKTVKTKCQHVFGKSLVGTKSGVVRIIPPANLGASRIKGGSITDCIAYLYSLDDILADPDIVAIVVGKPTQSFVARDHFVTWLEQEPPDPGPNMYPERQWAEGNLVVSRVLWSGSAGITAGSTIRFSEGVGLLQYGASGWYKTRIGDCAELRKRSEYVLILGGKQNGAYELVNSNLGRFNTDGTDTEDEVGGGFRGTSITIKQSLREELTAAYGVRFAVPTTAAPGITGSPRRRTARGSR